MSWLSSWWDKASGANQKIDPNKLGTQYDDAMAGVTAGYDKISEFAGGMMDPSSQQNMQMRAMMDAQGADAAAEASRLGGRQAAMAGGAPAAAMAAQTAHTANQAQAGSAQSFNQYLAGAQGQGASMLSGVLANQGQMQNQKFQMMQNQRQANAQADTAGAQFGANLLGSAIGMIPGLPFQEGGMAYDNIDDQLNYDNYYQQGGSVGPDGRQHYFFGGLAALAGVGAAKKGYEALEGADLKGKFEGLQDSVSGGLQAMKERAGETEYHYTEDQARQAKLSEWESSEEGKSVLGGLGDADAITNEELAAANTAKMSGDEGYQSAQMLADTKVQAEKDKQLASYDISQGAHQVGAGRALAEDIQPYTSGAYGLAKEGAGVIAGGIGAGAGLLGEGLKKGYEGVKRDWEKGDKSIGRNLLAGASGLLKEIGSPGYLQGKEMAKITSKKTNLKKIGEEPLGGEKAIPQNKPKPDSTATGVKIDDGQGGNILNPLGPKAQPKEASVFKTNADITPGVGNEVPTDINEAQQKLVDMGYDIGKTGVDGDWGPKSKAAYEKYQADLKSGKIDEEGIYQFGWDQKQQGGLIGMAEGGSIGPIWDKTKQVAEEYGGAALDAVHGALDVAGMVPGLGIIPDLANAGIYGAEALVAGDDVTRKQALGLMGLSGAAAIPLAGQFATAGKFGSKMAKASKNVSKVTPENRAIYNRATDKQFDLANPGYRDELQKARIWKKGENPMAEMEAGLKEPKWADPSKRQIVGPDGIDQISGLPVKGHPAGKFQEGGTVWDTHSSQPSSASGILSEVIGPSGPMSIPTRLGGFKVG